MSNETKLTKNHKNSVKQYFSPERLENKLIRRFGQSKPHSYMYMYIFFIHSAKEWARERNLLFKPLSHKYDNVFKHIYRATQTAYAINAREQAPSGATTDMFVPGKNVSSTTG